MDVPELKEKINRKMTTVAFSVAVGLALIFFSWQQSSLSSDQQTVMYYVGWVFVIVGLAVAIHAWWVDRAARIREERQKR